MGELQIRQEKIASYLKQLLQQTKQLDARVRGLENDGRKGFDPGLPFPHSPYVFFPVRVTSVNSGSDMFGAQILKPNSDANTPWVTDSDFDDGLAVSFAPPTTAPKVGDVVCAHFTGTHGAAFSPRYGLFDRSYPAQYCLVQSYCNTIGGDIPVKKCNSDGSSPAGDTFEIHLCVPQSRAPSVFEDDVLVYGEDDEGEYACLSDPVDAPFGTLRPWAGHINSITLGWRLCDGTEGTPDLRGRFLTGVHSGGATDLDSIGDTGGYAVHGDSENGHANHDNHRHAADAVTKTDVDVAHDGVAANVKVWDADTEFWTTGVTCLATNGGDDFYNHSNTDNRPPYYVVGWIIRDY